ncbi:MAG: hypothetical protein KatS3mg014_1656 [Actinomycetota bacterium]|nr:MAG: hypothetical protein KatS3mg014_1656 [Actinomycetota bacterium]
MPSRTSLGPVRPSCGGTLLSKPTDVAWDPAGTWLYVADTGNNRVVRMKGDGTQCEVVTTGADVPTGFKGPDYLTFDAQGRLYVSTNSYYAYRFIITA